MYYVVSYVDGIEVARSKGFKTWPAARKLERKMRSENRDLLGNIDCSDGLFIKIEEE